MPRSRSRSFEVHRPLDGGLIVAEGPGLFQERIHERGLAVVDMRDDGDVADIHSGWFPGAEGARKDRGAPLCGRNRAVRAGAQGV